MKIEKEFEQEELLFIWDACSVLLHEKTKGQHPDLQSIYEGSSEISMTEEEARNAWAELWLMQGVTSHIGFLIDIPEYKDRIKRESDRGFYALISLEEKINKFYASAKKQKA